MKKIFLIFLFFLNYGYAQVYLEQNSGVTANLTSVHTTNYGGTAWVCGYNGTVIRTDNGGINWINVTGSGIPSNITLVNIYGINPYKALAAGYIGTNTYVYRTSNYGINWTQVFTQPNGFINAVWIIDTMRGFMYGDPVGGRWSLWKTTNGGINWDSTGLYLPQAGSETGWNNALFCRNNIIWFGTNNLRIYYSTSFGSNWQTQSTAPEQNSKSIWFFSHWGTDTSSGLMGGGTLMQTSNMGVNWSPMASSGTGNFGGFTGNPMGVTGYGFPFLNLWYVRSDNKIYYSMAGTNWQPAYTAPAGSYNCLSLGIQTGVAFAVRNNGGITRIITQWGGIKSISNEVPSRFYLFQNYPNPFNPVTKIKFSLPLPSKGGAMDVKLIVYDVLGREVANLIPPLWGGKEGLSPGAYEVEWDGSNYRSGVYFYKLVVSGAEPLTTADPSTGSGQSFSETKKMVLVK